MADYLTDLPDERVAKYRFMATRAREFANVAQAPDVRDAYVAIAMAWEVMAIELQATVELEVLTKKHPKDLLAVTQKLPSPPIPPRR